MNKSIGLRIVSALVLLAVVAGVGAFAFRSGMERGLATNVAELPQFKDLPKDGVPPIMYRYDGFGRGYGMPFHRPHFGFGFGIFGFLFTLFLFFIALKALRVLFWGPRWGHMRGSWGRHWEGGVPPMFEEWHKRAHGEPTEEKKE